MYDSFIVLIGADQTRLILSHRRMFFIIRIDEQGYSIGLSK